MDESPSRARAIVENVFSVVGGVALVVVGVAGLVLPILPGWLLILAGVAVLASAVPPVRGLVSKLVTTRAAQAAISGAAQHDGVRRVVTRALQRPLIRRGLTTACRWDVMRLLLRKQAMQNEPSP